MQYQAPFGAESPALHHEFGSTRGEQGGKVVHVQIVSGSCPWGPRMCAMPRGVARPVQSARAPRRVRADPGDADAVSRNDRMLYAPRLAFAPHDHRDSGGHQNVYETGGVTKPNPTVCCTQAAIS